MDLNHNEENADNSKEIDVKSNLKKGRLTVWFEMKTACFLHCSSRMHLLLSSVETREVVVRHAAVSSCLATTEVKTQNSLSQKNLSSALSQKPHDPINDRLYVQRAGSLHGRLETEITL